MRLLLVALVLLGLGSTVMFVDSGEVAVVQRFGAVVGTRDPGLGFRLPWPIERDLRVGVTEVRRVELGRQRLLTGDTNLVEIELVAQYRVDDPVKWTMKVVDAEPMIRAEISAAAVAAIGRVGVDELLTSGRATLQAEVLRRAQRTLDAVGTGVRLEAIDIRDLAPPEAVVNAFNDVSSARGDQETTVLAAEAYASQALPDVRGRATSQVEAARAEASRQMGRAEAAVAEVKALAAAGSPVSTRRELWRRMAVEVGGEVTVSAVPAGGHVILAEKP